MAPNVGLGDFDADRDRGRDRDRFIERSMPLVVLDQCPGFRLGRPGEPKAHLDSLEDRRVASLPDGFEVDLQTLEAHPGVASAALHHQDTTGGDPGKKRIGGRDLFARSAQMRRLVDDKVITANLVGRAAGRLGRR